MKLFIALQRANLVLLLKLIIDSSEAFLIASPTRLAPHEESNRPTKLVGGVNA